jgi:hypothetical protein
VHVIRQQRRMPHNFNDIFYLYQVECCYLFLKYGFYDLILYLAVDVTVYHRGFHGDLNETFLIGNVSPEAKKLVQVTSECLLKAINIGKNQIFWIRY